MLDNDRFDEDVFLFLSANRHRAPSIFAGGADLAFIFDSRADGT